LYREEEVISVFTLKTYHQGAVYVNSSLALSSVGSLLPLQSGILEYNIVEVEGVKKASLSFLELKMVFTYDNIPDGDRLLVILQSGSDEPFDSQITYSLLQRQSQRYVRPIQRIP